MASIHLETLDVGEDSHEKTVDFGWWAPGVLSAKVWINKSHTASKMAFAILWILDVFCLKQACYATFQTDTYQSKNPQHALSNDMNRHESTNLRPIFDRLNPPYSSICIALTMRLASHMLASCRWGHYIPSVKRKACSVCIGSVAWHENSDLTIASKELCKEHLQHFMPLLSLFHTKKESQNSPEPKGQKNQGFFYNVEFEARDSWVSLEDTTSASQISQRSRSGRSVFRPVMTSPLVGSRTDQLFMDHLVGGWTNPSEKYSSKWESFPNRDENKKYLKTPPRSS